MKPTPGCGCILPTYCLGVHYVLHVEANFFRIFTNLQRTLAQIEADLSRWELTKKWLVAGSYVEVPNSHQQAVLMALFFPRGRPGFDSRPGHVSPGTSRLGCTWPWSSLSIGSTFFNNWPGKLLQPGERVPAMQHQPAGQLTQPQSGIKDRFAQCCLEGSLPDVNFVTWGTQKSVRSKRRSGFLIILDNWNHFDSFENSRRYSRNKVQH